MNTSGALRTPWQKRDGGRASVVVRSILKSRIHTHENRRFAKDLAWRWVGAKWPRLVPSASELEKSHIDAVLPGRKLSVATSEDGATWTLEVSHQERDGARTWTTQVVVSDAGDADVVAVQTSCTDVESARIIAPPGVLGSWVERLDVHDAGVPVLAEPRLLESPEQLDPFVEHLLMPERRLPVVVLANKPNTRYYGADPRGIAEAARGLAHVVCLAPEAFATFTQTVDRKLAPVQGAVRIYKPGFTAAADGKDHPLLRPEPSRPGAGALDGEPDPNGPAVFRRLLCLKLCQISVAATAA
ncbi:MULTISPECIES: hypothetical protein [Ramlibacter]|uniref:Uncharacterized protein n=1 Tax=Ramlibacter pinisoli TaxID=2682844 RepID=A0A6N8IVL9_9BURK|nr:MULTISPECIES: hypothetical protein [Ramlibacter]MBA2961046.1 hypothetical protein [Ramlibacter sp. CGMCC 1.13660]MVQ30991.1 hypothetical protein [Ramlibacter pinisoli]